MLKSLFPYVLMLVGAVIALLFTGPFAYVFGPLSIVPILVGVCVGLAGYELRPVRRPVRAGGSIYR